MITFYTDLITRKMSEKEEAESVGYNFEQYGWQQATDFFSVRKESHEETVMAEWGATFSLKKGRKS